MQEVFEKIVEKLESESHWTESTFDEDGYCNDDSEEVVYLHNAIEIVKQEAEKYNNGWIPCSERLPEERDWYLAVFEEVDTGFIGIPYIADYLMGSHTKFTTEDGWIVRNCSDREDESAEYYKNLRCVAWQPLTQPYPEQYHSQEDCY